MRVEGREWLLFRECDLPVLDCPGVAGRGKHVDHLADGVEDARFQLQMLEQLGTRGCELLLEALAEAGSRAFVDGELVDVGASFLDDRKRLLPVGGEAVFRLSEHRLALQKSLVPGKSL